MSDNLCVHCAKRPAAHRDLCRYCAGTRPFWVKEAESAPAAPEKPAAAPKVESTTKAASAPEKPARKAPAKRAPAKRAPRKK